MSTKRHSQKAIRQEGQLLKNLCDDIELSTAELAMLCGVDRTTVWRWMTGQTKTPTYARTIVDQQTRISKMVRQLNDE